MHYWLYVGVQMTSERSIAMILCNRALRPQPVATLHLHCFYHLAIAPQAVREFQLPMKAAAARARGA